jgi:photosynthetic reaction center H subunit
VVDLWVDRAEPLSVTQNLMRAGRRIAADDIWQWSQATGLSMCKSIRSDQFAQVPGLSNPDQVTLQEEDRISAFYGGGHLYAMPMRSEPLIWV